MNEKELNDYFETIVSTFPLSIILIPIMLIEQLKIILKEVQG